MCRLRNEFVKCRHDSAVLRSRFSVSRSLSVCRRGGAVYLEGRAMKTCRKLYEKTIPCATMHRIFQDSRMLHMACFLHEHVDLTTPEQDM